GFWNAERGLRDRFRAGARNGRRAGKCEPEAALLGGGRAVADQWNVRLVRAAGVAAEGAAQQLLLEARESSGVAAAFPERQGSGPSGGRAADGIHRAAVVAAGVCHLRRHAVWLDEPDSGIVAGRGGHLSGTVRRVPGEAGAGKAGRTPGDGVRLHRRHLRLLHVWVHQDRAVAVLGDSGVEPDGRRMAVGAVDHVAQRAAQRAGATAGSDKLAARHRRVNRPGAVYVGVFKVDWSARPDTDRGIAVLPGVGAADGGAWADPVCDAA